ncbi:hypothetical protein [Mariniflexile sp.]|uniref:hypothetical protein n=1 Tax=Mariniflexile sp. TaxID=1979402 RepID=UPI0040471787
MKSGKRKEVVLDKEMLSLSKDYKIMIDKSINNHNNGKTNYTAWSTVKKEQFR